MSQHHHVLNHDVLFSDELIHGLRSIKIWSLSIVRLATKMRQWFLLVPKALVMECLVISSHACLVITRAEAVSKIWWINGQFIFHMLICESFIDLILVLLFLFRLLILQSFICESTMAILLVHIIIRMHFFCQFRFTWKIVCLKTRVHMI